MKLHKIALVSTVAILASVGGAWAADPVIYEQAPEAEVISAYDWSGVYIGIQGGYGWADLDADSEFAGEFSGELDGGFAGVYAGYNFQWNNLVLGIEGDINKGWLEDEQDGAEAEIDWFGSIRGRAGFAWDRTMIFGTAGVAFANLDFEGPGFEGDEDFTGWTIGAGIEHAFTENLLARAEYRYYDFGDGDTSNSVLGDTDFELDMHTVSVGLAYKF